MEILRGVAERRGVSLGEAASDLIRKGSRYQLATKRVNGLPVFEVPADFPVVTDEMVRNALEEEA